MFSGQDLLRFIESLESELTNPERSLQKSGLDKLNEKLSLISYDALDESELETLLVFYINKLDDHYSLIRPLVQGLLTLVKFSSLSSRQVHNLITNLFTKVQTQSLPQSDRNIVFNILTNLASSHSQTLISMGYDFVFQFIQTIDGEKDPRNLVLTFRLAIWVMRNFEIERFAEDIFEVVSCYFPIDFSPPSNDVHKISREQLIDLNLDCMAGSPLFAEFCQPLILEKLTSDLASSRECALLALSKCAAVYHIQDLSSYQASYIDCFYQEYHRQDKEAYKSLVINCVHSLATAYVKKGSTEQITSLSVDIFKKFASDIFSRDHKVAHKSSSFISKMFSVGPPFSISLAENFLSFIVKNFHLDEENQPRCYALHILVSILSEESLLSTNYDDLKTVLNSMGGTLKSRLHCYMMQLREKPNILDEMLALNLLCRLMFFPSVIPSNEQSAILDLLMERSIDLTSEMDEELVSDEEWTSVVSVPPYSWRLDSPNDYAFYLRIQLIHMIGVFLSYHFQSDSAKALLTRMKKSVIDGEQVQIARRLYWQVLTCFVCKCARSQEIDWLMNSILSLEPASDDCMTVSSRDDIKHHLCRIFYHLLLHSLPLSSEEAPVVALLRNCVFENWTPLISANLSSKTVTCLSEVFILLTALTFTDESQENLVKKCLDSQISVKKLAVHLASSIILGLNVKVSTKLCDKLLNFLYDNIEQLSDNLTSDSDLIHKLSRSYAFLVYKCSTDSSAVDEVLKRHIASTCAHLSTDSHDSLRFTIWLLWLLHFLLLSKRPSHTELSSALLEKLVKLLVDDGERGRCVVTNLYVITNPPSDDISFNGYQIFHQLSTISDSLFAQKCFYCVAEKLKVLIDVDDGQDKDLLLTGYLRIIGNMPEEILCEEAPNILPLVISHILTRGIVTSGNVNDNFCLCLQLLTKLSNFEMSLPILEEYFHDLIQLILDITDSSSEIQSFQSELNYFEVRFSICRLLVQLANLPAHILTRHRRSVLKVLKKLTDDRKRLIRKQAVQAINVWS